MLDSELLKKTPKKKPLFECKLDTSVAVITGGGGGLGQAVAQAIVETFNIPCALMDIGGGLEAAQAVAESEPMLTAFECDVTDETACEAACEAVVAAYAEQDRKPRILINTAGITIDKPFHKMTPPQWRRVIEVNLIGTGLVTMPFFRIMREETWGRVVNFSSVNAFGHFGQANYSASKGGVDSFTRSLAIEGMRYGITANAVRPGYTRTAMTQAIPEEIRNMVIESEIPMKRMAEPEEIAHCVTFLVSPKAAFITGSCIDDNGGQHFT